MDNWHRRGDHPVDTHVLLHHGRAHPSWLDQCIASLESEPTNILIVDSTDTNVGALRAHAIAQGSAPFVSFVDDDDFVHPGAFAACIDVIGPGIVGAYTDFRAINADTEVQMYVTNKGPWSAVDQLTQPFTVLHLHVWRRSATTPAILAELARWETLEEAYLMGALVAFGRWTKVDVVGYTKRQHTRGAGARITPAMMSRLTMQLAPLLLPKPVARKVQPAVPCRFCAGVRRMLGIR